MDTGEIRRSGQTQVDELFTSSASKSSAVTGHDLQSIDKQIRQLSIGLIDKLSNPTKVGQLQQRITNISLEVATKIDEVKQRINQLGTCSKARRIFCYFAIKKELLVLENGLNELANRQAALNKFAEDLKDPKALSQTLFPNVLKYTKEYCDKLNVPSEVKQKWLKIISECEKNLDLNRLTELGKNMYTCAKIFALEKATSLGQVRPQDVNKLIEQLENKNERAVNHYIANLEKTLAEPTIPTPNKEDYGDDDADHSGKIDVTTAVTLADEPTIIQMGEDKRQIVGSGSYGVADKQAALTQKEGKFERSEYISKSDSRLDQNGKVIREESGETEKEYTHMKALWDQSSKTEREFILPVVAQHTQKGIIRPERFKYVTKFFNQGDLHDSYRKIPLQGKLQVAESLLTSLNIILKKGFVLCDIKPENMLVSKKGDQYRAVLSDYGGLYDFKNVNAAQLREIRKSGMSSWTPNYLNFQEFQSIQADLQKLEYQFSTLTAHQRELELANVKVKLEKLQIFCIGVSLYEMYVGEKPYPQVPCEILIGGGHLIGYFTQNPDPRQNIAALDAKLKAQGCPDEMRQMILKMIHPDINQRATAKDLQQFSV